MLRKLWSGLLATGLLAANGYLLADGPPVPPPVPVPNTPSAPRMVTSVFPVADLVCLPPNTEWTGGKLRSSDVPSDELCADRLITQITSMIAPGTWEADGGKGRIEYFEASHSLVVCHTPETVEQIGAALERMTARQETTVAFDLRVVRVPAGSCDATLQKFGIDTESRGVGAVIGSLPGRHAGMFCDEVAAAPAATVLRLPKATVFHGQKASLVVGEEKPALTDRVFTLADGIGYAIPESMPATRHTGVSVGLCPLVARDRKSMKVRLSWETCQEQPGTITLNAGGKVTLATFKDGKPAGTADVCVTESAKAFNLKSCQCTLVFGDPKTHVIDMGVRNVQGKREQSYLLISGTILRRDGHTNAVKATPVRVAMPAPPPSLPSSTVMISPPVPSQVESPRPQVYAKTLIVKMSPEMAEKHGLTQSVAHFDEAQVNRITALLRSTESGCEILSAPQLMLMDKQVGYCQDGSGQTLRMTPTFSADGRYVRMKMEAECAGPAKQCCDVDTVIPDGRTACLALAPKAGGKAAEEKVFLIVTPHMVHPPMPTPVTLPAPARAPVQAVPMTAAVFRTVSSGPADRKAKAAEWVKAYEKACAGAPGPSPTECAMRALAEDPNCFAKPATK